MSIWGKVIGGVAGFAFGGPFGALLGAVAGHALDTMRNQQGRPGVPAGGESHEVAFATAVIVLAAKLAKVDGRVTRDEVEAFKQVFHIPQNEMANVGRLFNEAKKDATGYEPYAREIARVLGHEPAVLAEVLAALFHVAKADGGYHPSEREFLSRVAQVFGFGPHEFARLESMHIAPKEADPYTVLGLAHGASNEELKKTYRRLVREHHPDTLFAKGLPKEFIDLANEKVAAINGAYDRIQAERNGATSTRPQG